MTRIFVFVCALFLAAPAAAGDGEAAVMATIERFFEGLSAGDGGIWREVLDEDAVFHVQRQQADGSFALERYRGMERADSLNDNTVALDERFYDPTVLVRGPIAVVWAPYDIVIDGALSHCGIDVFTLIHSEGAWKITNLTYTVEPGACAALGIPPRS